MTRTMNGSPDRILWREGSVKGKSAPRKSKVLIITLFLFFSIVISLFYVWSRIQVIQVGYKVSHAMKEQRALAETNKKLRVEAAQLKSYARIEKLAVEELKMSKPTSDQVVVIR